MTSLLGPAFINVGFTNHDVIFRWLDELDPTVFMVVGDYWKYAEKYPNTDLIYRQVNPRDDNLHRNIADPGDWVRLVSPYPSDTIHTLGNELPSDDPYMWEFMYNALILAAKNNIRTCAFNFSVTMPQHKHFFVSPYAKMCFEVISDYPGLLSVGIHLYKNAHLQHESYLDLSHHKLLDAVCDDWNLPYVNKYVTECFWDSSDQYGTSWAGIVKAGRNLGATDDELAEQMITAVEQNWLYDRHVLGVVPFIVDEGIISGWSDFSFRSKPEVLEYFIQHKNRLDVSKRQILDNKGCLSKWVK